MKITVCGINYSPELIGIAVYNTDFCKFMAGAGHQVTVVTGFPYYPGWRKRPGDSGKLYATEKSDRATIQRCWQYVPAKPAVFNRMVHEASFTLTSAIKLLFLPAPDVYVVISPPLLLGLVAAFLSMIKRRPFLYHVQDLQPDAALRLGMLKPGLLADLLFAISYFAYEHAARVSSISKAMCDSIQSQGVSAAKVIYWPNWVDISSASEVQRRGAWKERFGIPSAKRIVSYAGNIGAKQGLEMLIDAAAVVQETHPDVLIVMAGDGAAADDMRRICAEKRVENVLFQNVLSKEDHAALLTDSDLCVIPQKRGSSAAFLPSKLLKILAMGRPIVTNADSDGALYAAVAEGGFGVCAEPGDPKSLANAIIELLSNPERLAKLGSAGQQYVMQFERTNVLSRIEKVLQEIHTSA
jgi:colanic acid biosynthesis glycosyl transferase WcaI